MDGDFCHRLFNDHSFQQSRGSLLDGDFWRDEFLTLHPVTVLADSHGFDLPCRKRKGTMRD